MKVFIFTGGSIVPENIIEKLDKDDMVISADSGYLNAELLGFKTDVLVGDFDSLGRENIPDGIEKVELPCEKDLTDTQVACDMAIEAGANQIVIIGGLDGRLDHTLSNMAVLRELSSKGIYSYITDGKNRVRYINSTGTIIARSAFKYLSLIADDKVVKGVSIEGCKYPLKDAKIYRERQFAVSNEIVGNCALVSARKGGLFIVESDPQ